MPPTSSSTAFGCGHRATVVGENRHGTSTGPLVPLTFVEFRRINALPPYAFAQIDALKMQLRRAGEDVIDLAFGNPDIPSPDGRGREADRGGAQPAQPSLLDEQGHPEAARWRSPTSTSASSASTLDFETEVCSTIGAKEGFSHLMLTLVGPGDTALVPSPSYPIHIWGPILAGAGVHYVRMGPDQDFFANLHTAYEQAWPRPRVIVTSFPHNPTTACVDLDVHDAARRVRARARDRRRARLRVRRPRLRRLQAAVDPAGARREGCRGRAVHADEVVLDGRLAHGLPRRQRRDRRRARQAEVVPRLRHVPADPDRGDRRDERGARLPEGSERDLPRPPRRADRRARRASAGTSNSPRGRCSCGPASPSPTPS